MEWRGYHLFWAPLLCVLESAHSQLSRQGRQAASVGYLAESKVLLCPTASTPKGVVRFLLSSVIMGKSG